jgi:hypothetical protein
LHQIGWIMGQKFGRADEYVQFREMFREDDDFHRELNDEVVIDDALGFDGRPDQWLVGRLWYQRAQSAVDTMGIPLRGKSPLIFHSSNPMSLINYAGAIEEEGVLGETAMRAWRDGARGLGRVRRTPDSNLLGPQRPVGRVRTSPGRSGSDGPCADEMLPGVREQIEQEKRDELTPEQLAALDTPEYELTDDMYEAWLEAKQRTQVTHREVADRAEDPQLRERARKLAGRIEETRTLADRTAQYRGDGQLRVLADSLRGGADAGGLGCP